MVVAKDDLSHMRLCEQFKARTVSRIYHSVTLGCPASTSGRVETNIVRDPANRLRMTTAAYGSGRGRMAASNYRVLERFAGCGAALVEWKLDTGRTHQIRCGSCSAGHLGQHSNRTCVPITGFTVLLDALSAKQTGWNIATLHDAPGVLTSRVMCCEFTLD